MIQETKTKNQNDPVVPPPTPSTPTQVMAKEISLLVITLILFLGFWFSLDLSFSMTDNGSIISFITSFSLVGFILPLIVLLPLLCAIALTNILVKHKWTIFVCYLIGVISFFLFFPINLISLIILALLYLALFAAFYQMRDETQVRKKIRVAKIMKHGIPGIILMLAIAAAGAYYFTAAKITSSQELAIKPEYLEKATKPLQPLLNKLIPNFDLNMPVQEAMISALIQKQGEAFIDELDPRTLPPEFDELADKYNLNLYDKESLKKEMADNSEMREEMISLIVKLGGDNGEGMISESQELFGIKYKAEDSVMKVATSLVNNALQKYLKPYQKYFPLIFSILFFFELKVLSYLSLWLAYLIGGPLLKLLAKLKFAKMYYINTKSEEITL